MSNPYSHPQFTAFGTVISNVERLILEQAWEYANAPGGVGSEASLVRAMAHGGLLRAALALRLK